MSRVSFIKHYDFIVNQRRLGKGMAEIASDIGANRSALSRYCSDNGIGESGVSLSLPPGSINVLRTFDADQLRHMDAQAKSIDCKTIAEYVIELARDKLAEEMGEMT